MTEMEKLIYAAAFAQEVREHGWAKPSSWTGTDESWRRAVSQAAEKQAENAVDRFRDTYTSRRERGL